MSRAAPKPASMGKTVADLLAIPEAERFHELIEGQIVPKASPTGEHGYTQSWIVSLLNPPFGRRAGGRAGGGS